jgi:hypothetical protein
LISGGGLTLQPDGRSRPPLKPPIAGRHGVPAGS